MEYLNFDLRVWQRDGGGYRLLAASEGHGEAEAEIPLDPDEPGLRSQLRRLAERDTDRGALEALGSALFDLLLVDDVETLFQRSYGDVEGEGELGLRLRLRIGPPEVAALPWELLYSRSDGEFVATRVASPVVRYVEIPKVPRELATKPPLRVLVAIPRGGAGLPPVSWEREQAAVDRALAGLEDDAEVTYVHQLHDDGRVTWRRVRECLAEGAYHCFHFVGHGAFRDGKGHLALDAEEGGDGGDHGVDFVADERFADLFTNHRTMKLVLLNACESATLSTSHPLEGCAARLVAEGVPAVVAMQYSVRDAAAVDFARSFYHSLFRSAERGRVDVAVSQGRHVLAANHPGQRELATPVLFMHTESGVLFVPERGGAWRDLPYSSRARDTLRAAQAETGSETEAARFRRRIRLARATVRTAFAASLLVFALLFMDLLDVLYLDTGFEFLVMAVGDAVAEQELSDDLRIVTLEIDGGREEGCTLEDREEEGSPGARGTPEMDGSAEADTETKVRKIREKTTVAVRELSAAGARVVALDLFFKVEDGGFATAPDAGDELVETIRAVAGATSVVVGANDLADGALTMPEELRSAVSGVGHLCHEHKLRLARSLPVAVNKDGRQVPSLALAAYAAFRGGEVAPSAGGAEEPAAGLAEVRLPAGPVRFPVSEFEEARNSYCGVIEAGDVVAHRFLRLRPVDALEKRRTSAGTLGADALREEVQGKLVVIGHCHKDDVVYDLAEKRAGVYWHADAINNLLLGEYIRPLSKPVQLPIMLLLAGCAAAVRLRYRRRRLGLLLVTALVVVFLIVVVYAYGKFDMLINPAYHLVAVGFAWWLAAKTGDTWLR